MKSQQSKVTHQLKRPLEERKGVESNPRVFPLDSDAFIRTTFLSYCTQWFLFGLCFLVLHPTLIIQPAFFQNCLGMVLYQHPCAQSGGIEYNHNSDCKRN